MKSKYQILGVFHESFSIPKKATEGFESYM